jgi:outer membrane protein assembly factor BamD
MNNLARRVRCAAAVVAALIVVGCAAGMPSIPNTPDDIIKKGDRYYERGRYFQASELYKAFLARHAGHDRSDYAQFMVAECLFDDEQYALAAVEYRLLITNYGYSEYVDDGYFKEALCNYRQSPKPGLDQTKTLEALSQFEQFVRVFGDSPKVGEAQKYISEIHEKLAHKDLENAKYYFGRKRYISAIIYLDKIIDNYPDNSYWVEAKYLKAKALYRRGERFDEALELLNEVIDYPENLRVKRNAEILAGQVRGEMNE